MSKPLGYAYIKEGQASLNLEPSDLFDKIINLKLIRKKGPPIVIRSDYEAVFHNDGGNGQVSFKKCVQKPEIKVTYKQVAQAVAIEVDIKITNLFLDGIEENTDSLFTSEGDPVTSCVIQMGYRKQFTDYTSEAHREDVEGFYNLKIPDSGSLWRQITVQILTGYRESYPPDNVTCFNGVIGTMEDGLRWAHTEANLIPGYGDGQFPEDFGEIESVLYQYVTRRFIRAGVQHTAETDRQQIKIYGYSSYTDPGSGAMDRLDASKRTANLPAPYEDVKELELLENGIMSIKDANMFGVVCACSNTLRTLPHSSLVKYGRTPERAAKIGTVSAAPFDDMIDTLGGQLAAIQQHYPYLRWFILTDGSFYFYHVRDNEADLWMDDYLNHMKRKNIVPLPGIYDMTPSGTRTIRCPFISFLSPMTTVLFQSRYDIGTQTGFFYPVKTNAFLVILATIEFSTTGDENVMELMCVDMPPHAVQIGPNGEVIPEAHTPVETPEVAKAQSGRNLQWERMMLTIVPHKKDATTTDSSWGNIVKNDILGRLDWENYPGELEAYNITKVLEFLKEANPEYFDPGGEYMKRGNSIENNPSGIGGLTLIRVPWLKAGDKIVIRSPVRPAFNSEEYYPPEEEVRA